MKISIKSKFTILAAALATFGACSVSMTPTPALDVAATVQKTLPYLRTSASLATTGIFIAEQPAKRAALANYISAAAVGLRTITGTSVPTGAQVHNVITSFTKGGPDAQSYESLAVSLINLYDSVLPKLQGNPALAVTVINEIASGCEDAAGPYLAK